MKDDCQFLRDKAIEALNSKLDYMAIVIVKALILKRSRENEVIEKSNLVVDNKGDLYYELSEN